jgi:hypothetical protein
MKKARTCERHGDKRAKWPKNDPHFCTMKCAANHAIECTRYQWCDKHGDWFHPDDGCYECQKDGGDE